MSGWTIDGNGLEADARVLRDYDMLNFPRGNTGAQMGGWFRKEIKHRRAT